MWTESYPYFAVFGQILRFNVKVSYSSMPNMKNIDKKIINPPKDNIARTCNCIRKHQYPLNEKCLTNNALYKASITPNEKNAKTKFIMVLVKQH